MDRTVQDIERAIDALTPRQREELYLWLDERHLRPIGAQLEADLQAGRIVDRISRALADHKAGTTRVFQCFVQAPGPCYALRCHGRASDLYRREEKAARRIAALVAEGA